MLGKAFWKTINNTLCVEWTFLLYGRFGVLSASGARPGVYEGICLSCHMIFNSYDFKTLSHLYSRSNVATEADGSRIKGNFASNQSSAGVRSKDLLLIF